MGLLVRWLARKAIAGASTGEDSALVTLKQLYARGAIGREKFERMKAERR